MRRRLEEYAEKTRPLKRLYAERGLVSELDGLGTPAAILARTRQALGSGAGAAA